MKIKLLKDAIGPRGNCGAGCTVDFPDDVAMDLIDSCKAVIAEDFYKVAARIDSVLNDEQENIAHHETVVVEKKHKPKKGGERHGF